MKLCRSVRSLTLVLLGCLLLIPRDGWAQEVPLPITGVTTSDLVAATLWLTPQQLQRKPVYDFAGEVISYDLIFSRTDESGLKGAFWGGLGGFLLGSIMGAIMGGTDCPYSLDYCSPRERALFNSSVTAGMGLGLMIGIKLGWDSDQTTWWEAIDQIRGERLEAAGGGQR